jgi:hypothetical protein
MGYGNSPARDEVAVTILSGASQSQAINTGGRRIIGVKMPAGWDAAGITFLALTRRDTASPPNDTYSKVQDAAGAEVALATPALDTYVAVADTSALVGLGWVKVRSGTSGVPVNQTANRTFYLVLL